MYVAKTKALISFAVTAKLICVFFSHMQNVGFLMTQLNYFVTCTCITLYFSIAYNLIMLSSTAF